MTKQPDTLAIKRQLEKLYAEFGVTALNIERLIEQKNKIAKRIFELEQKV